MDIDKFKEAKAHNEAAAKKLSDKARAETDDLSEKLEKTFVSVKEKAKDLAQTAEHAINGLSHKIKENETTTKKPDEDHQDDA